MTSVNAVKFICISVSLLVMLHQKNILDRLKSFKIARLKQIEFFNEFIHFSYRFYDELLNAGTLKEFTGKIIGPNRFDGNSKHFVTPSGINSLVKHFLSQVGKYSCRMKQKL